MILTGNFFLRFALMILTLGFITHIVGIPLITDGSKHTTLSNAGLFIPALILCLFDAQLRKKIFSTAYLPVISMLLFTIVIAGINSHSENSAFSQFKTSLYVLLYLATAAILARENRLTMCLNVSFFIAGILAIASLVVQSIAQEKNIFLGNYRLFSLGYEKYADFQNPIIAALYYGFFGVYGFHQLMTGKHSRVTSTLIAVCLCGLSLYLYCTLSRGVWLGYGLAILTTALLHHNRHSRKWLLLAAGLAGLLAIWLWPVLFSRGLSLRDIIWGQWFDRIKEFWLIGAGAGRKFEICIAQNHCFNQAHNLFLQFFYEYGIIGLTLLLSMLILAFKRSLIRSYWSTPLGGVGLPLLIFATTTALFDYHTVMNRPGVYWLVFWLPIGLVLSQPSPTPAQPQGKIHAG